MKPERARVRRQSARRLRLSRKALRRRTAHPFARGRARLGA